MVVLNWLGQEQRTFLERGYLPEGQTPERRYEIIAETIERISGITGIKERFEGYISKNWVSFSTPVLANFGEPKNLPISCNHGWIEDSLSSILGEIKNVGMMAKYGAGTAKNFSKIRPIGSQISGGGSSQSVIDWIRLYSEMIEKVSQGATRRGFFTAYLSLDHPEIDDFLKIGTEGHPIQNITTAVTIPKGYRQALADGDASKRRVWATVMKRRAEVGFPYILDEENCNKNCPSVYIDKGLWINNSNICIEAIEYADENKEFACCLSSVNAARYDEWKDDETFLIDMFIMLDCVITEYLQKGEGLEGMEKAMRFAKEHRSIGLGVLGFHSYLQSKMIPFGSLQSIAFNNEMFKKMREAGEKATKWMASNWGEPEMLKGYGRRNTSLLAQAPTKSTSFIMGGYSQGIEPLKSNYHTKDLAKVQVEYKNPHLEQILEQKGQNTKKVWKSILEHNGSVQHLDFLSEHEKNVFKTFSEISQKDVIILAANRQKYIDMGQSINLMIHPNTPPKEVNKLVMEAFDLGVKSLYYQYSINAVQEYNQELLHCSACEA
jgi:ribonucleoside-diphosphate reductase alpha chain